MHKLLREHLCSGTEKRVESCQLDRANTDGTIFPAWDQASPRIVLIETWLREHGIVLNSGFAHLNYAKDTIKIVVFKNRADNLKDSFEFG